MSKLEEIEKRLLIGVHWSGRNAYYETDVALLIRAVRQLGAKSAAVQEYLEDGDAVKIGGYNNIDPDVLELFEEA